MKKKFNTFIKSLDLGWELVKDLLIILGGAAVQAVALRLFLVPTDLVVGGVTGVAQILYHFIHTPIGLVTLLGNIPLFFDWLAIFGRSALCYSHDLGNCGNLIDY